MKLELSFQVATSRPLPTRASFRRWANAAMAGLRRRRVALTVRVVGPKESASLNSRFRGKTGPTNVLSFPFENPPGMRGYLLGDIVICADVVQREARAQGKAERAHWAHMVVHGILHLRGHDHEHVRDAAVMESKEIRILRALGFPNPYEPESL